MKYRVYTSGLVAALLTTSSLTADGMTDKLMAIGLTSHDVRFSKNESDQLEVTITNDLTMLTISKMEKLPGLDVHDGDTRFMKQTSDHTYFGIATYGAVIASLPIGKQPSYERWMRIVNDLTSNANTQRLMPKISGKKLLVDTKVAKTA